MKNFFLLLSFLVGFTLNVNSQSVIWQTGFEDGDNSPTVSVTTALSHGVQGSGGNYGPKCWRIVSTGGSGKTYDGSLITPLLTFNSSRYYRVTVYARVGSTGNGQVYAGTLKIAKSLTASNASMKSASGDDIILNEGSNNVNALNYIKFQVNFTVSSTETKYIGFQMFHNVSASQFMQIDDIKIEESFSPFVPVACKSQAASMTDSYISNVTFNEINNSSTESRHYTDFSNVSTVVNINSTYGMSVSKSQNGSTPFIGRFAAWIDWNQNGSFDSNELVLSDLSASHGPVTADVTVPSGALPGKTQMRVIFREESSVPVSCGIFSTWGETEDYTIFVEDEIITLPVTLTSFTTSCDGGIPVLNWTTASEQNSDYFQIERSGDGLEWVIISKIPAAGNSNTNKNYQFYDMTTGRFEGYYRLKQVDFDGKFEYFNPIYSNCLESIKYLESEVFPNPTSKEVFLGIRNDKKEYINICISDQSGRVLLKKEINIIEGYTLERFDFSSYSNGFYFINIKTSDNEYIHKIVKI